MSMDKQAILEFLQENPYLDTLSDAGHQRLAEHVELVTIPAETELLSTGEEARYLSIIVNGQVRLGVRKQGTFTLIDRLERHRLIGWSSIIPPYIWSLDAITDEETELLRFDGPHLRRLCKEDPAFGVELMTCIVKAVTRRLNATRASLLDHSC